MESVDMKKLETAIVYLQRIADGKNPINNLPAEEESVLNNPNVIRCMFFVKEVLEEVKRNNGYIGQKAKKSEKLLVSAETLEKFTYQEDKPISKFVEQMNECVDLEVYKKINYQLITKWLRLNEFLKEEHSQELNKTVTLPTEKGSRIGIYAEKRRGSSGMEYMIVMYGKMAQEYIVRNVEKILDGEKTKNMK